MAIPDDKERIMITLPKDVIKRIDRISERYHMTRSEVLCLAFEQAEEMLNRFDLVGLSPENIRAMSEAIAKGFEIFGLRPSHRKVKASG